MISDTINIINLSAYTKPESKESKRGDWVEYGEDNNYFQFLIDRYKGSTTHHSIIDGVVNMIYGQGLYATNSQDNIEGFVFFKKMLRPECLRNTIFDFKLLGEASFQVIYNADKKVSRLKHFPHHTLRPGKKNKAGEITEYHYHPNWVEKKESDKVKLIPAFGTTKGTASEILTIKRYVTGQEYFSSPDYSEGGLDYALLEEEIANYLINDVQNSFSGTKVVNFNNGVPDKEKREEISREVNNKLTGSKGQKVIVSFNNDKERATSVEDISLNDAPSHYEYLAKECFEKLIVAHRVTSPMILGIRTGNEGLGNNAEEIRNAVITFDNFVIKPIQNLFIDAINSVLAMNGIALDLYFKTLIPIEFTDVEKIDDKAEIEKETGVKQSLSAQTPTDSEMLEQFEGVGEELDESLWELVEEGEAGDNDEEEAQLKRLQSMNEGLALSLSAEEKSKWGDSGLYKLRYRYDGETTPKSREYCVKMIDKNKGSKYGMLYRKEDIDRLSKKMPNKGFGLNGADYYDLFMWKGGPNCNHFWKRMIFFRKRKDGQFLPKSKTEQLENDKQVANVPFVPKKGQEGQRNIDRNDRGYKNG